MIKNVLSEIGGVGLYGVISISLFFLVFTAALVRVCLLKKSVVHELSGLPLEDGIPTSAQKGEARHE
jgi:hypothetical protein